MRAADKHIHYVLGFVKDKDLSAIIPLIPKGSSYHFVKPTVIRGMDAELTKQHFNEYNINGTAHQNISAAINAALQSVVNKETEMIFIGGSNFVVADVLALKEANQLAL